MGFGWSSILELEVFGEVIIDFSDFFRGELVTRRSSPGSTCGGACRAALQDSGNCGFAGSEAGAAGIFAAGPSLTGTITGVVILVFLDLLDLDEDKFLVCLILVLLAT